MLAVISLFQLHAIVVNNTILRHMARLTRDQPLCRFCANQSPLFFRNTGSEKRQMVPLSGILQIIEVRDNCYLSGVKGKIDHFAHRGQPKAFRCRVELQQLIPVEALQLFSKPVQLVYVRHPVDHPAQCWAVCRTKTCNAAVLIQRCADLDFFQRTDRFFVLIFRNWELDCNSSQLRAIVIFQRCFEQESSPFH